MSNVNIELNLLSAAARPVTASACGKAILVGEHAVVYGSRAVALPLKEMRLHLIFQNFSSGYHESKVKISSSDRQMTERVCDVVGEAGTFLGLECLPRDISGQSQLPIGAGVGSSAALCVGTLRGLAKSGGLELNPIELAELANRLERRFHGNPSGLDTAVVAHEACLLFQRENQCTPIPIQSSPGMEFVLIDSGIRASTKAMIQVASPFFRGGEGERRIANFDRLSVEAGEALSRGDAKYLAEKIKECSRLLDDIGVVTDDLKAIMAGCVHAGCLAAKASGAGGGGVVLALMDRTHKALTLKKLCEKFGSDKVYPIQVGTEG